MLTNETGGSIHKNTWPFGFLLCKQETDFTSSRMKFSLFLARFIYGSHYWSLLIPCVLCVFPLIPRASFACFLLTFPLRSWLFWAIRFLNEFHKFLLLALPLKWKYILDSCFSTFGSQDYHMRGKGQCTRCIDFEEQRKK